MIREPIPFLANVALVAHADGKLTAQEMVQLEEIRKDYGVKKSDFSAALALAANGDYRLTPVGTFADQVRNLECILRVALARGDLGTKEAELITSFCTATGISKEQLDRLHEEVLALLDQKGQLCPSCGAESPTGSRFCGKCGANLVTSVQDIQVTLDIPRCGVAIAFAESTAASFPKVLEFARHAPGFQKCQKGKKIWYMASFPGGNLADAMPLAEELRGIRNRTLYMDGKEAEWDEVFGFSWCAAERDKAYRPTEYCFGKADNRLNPWGCQQAKMDWTDWANWFCYGCWEKAGVVGKKVRWRFDKERIRHELATNLYRFRYCPHIVPKLYEAVLRHLPDTVVPESDANWDYHRNYEEVPGAIKVIQKEDSPGYTVSNEFWADGVRPKGIQALAAVLVKAFQELGMDLNLVNALMK